MCEYVLYISGDVVWWGTGIVTHKWLAVAVDQEFFEVPADIFAAHRCVEELGLRAEDFPCGRTVAFQECVEWMFFFSIDIQLLKKWEIRLETIPWSHVFNSIYDLQSSSAWFLLTELIAGKSQNFEARRIVVTFECIQLGVVPCETSVGCYIDN